MRKNRHGKIRIKKLALFIVMALCALVILIFGIGKGVSYLLGKVDTGNSPISYYLLIGTDKEAGNEADAVILTVWNSKDKGVTFISIPPNTKLARQEKKNQLIRTTFSEGGAEETKSAVENLLHLRIDKYAVLDYSNFRNYVDKIGGVDMYVEKGMDHQNREGETDIQIRQGYQSLDGENALGYVRYIDKKNGEIDRIQRQERFLKTMIHEMQDHAALYNWFFFHHSWTAEETNITNGEAASLAYTLSSYPKDSFTFSILPGETQNINKVDTWVTNPVEVQKTIAQTIGSDNR
jgi:polyisoprenyl-teichoic acid--peptidoglycan teichoic acid transferase